MKTINKLVRDNIPDILSKNNKTFDTSLLSDDQEYIAALKQKLVEEAHEVLETTNKETMTHELADVLEVIEALMKASDITLDNVIKVKEEKAITNGKFDKRIFLCNLKDNDI